jgi:phosphonate transport system substrate-binding protein
VTPPALVFANFLAPNLTPAYAYVAERVGTLLGRGGVLAKTADEEALVGGGVDVAFLCGLPYVRLAALVDPPVRAVAAPVVNQHRYDGRPIYFSDVIVRRNGPVTKFPDLRDRVWAHTQPTSFSGCVLTRYHLLQLGETERFFGRVMYSGSHLASIQAVLAGKVDASAIDSHVLGVELKRRPALASEIRVIQVLGPSTIPPVVVSSKLTADVQTAIRDALVGLSGEDGGRERLAEGLIERFVPVDDSDYDDIRRKSEVVASAHTAWLASAPRGEESAAG